MKVTMTTRTTIEIQEYDVEDVPDWTPKYQQRTIAPDRLILVWEDGKVVRFGIIGPYRLKSGKLSAQSGGNGDPDWRPMYNRTDFYHGERDDLPGWAAELIAQLMTTMEANR